MTGPRRADAAQGRHLLFALARRGAGDLRTVVLGAVALRVLAGSADPQLSDDVYRYLWEGEVVLEGASPFAFAPDDRTEPAIERARRAYPELHASVNHRDVSAVYPPLAQAIGTGSAALCRAFDLAPETWGTRILRIVYGLADLLVIWPLSILLRRSRLPPTLVVAWAWSPLAAVEFAGSGHLDALGILLLLGALAAMTREQGRDAGRADAAPVTLLAAGILAKYVPLLALPWFARGPGSLRRVASVLALVLLGFGPVLLLRGGGAGLMQGFEQYALRWEASSLVHRWLEGAFDLLFVADETWTDPRRLARGVAATAWLAFAVHTVVRVRDPAHGVGRLVGAWLVLSPTLHPWYLAWILPFLALRASAAWSWLVLVAPLLYWPLPGWQRDGIWNEPPWLWPFLALPFFGLLARGRMVRLGPRPGSM